MLVPMTLAGSRSKGIKITAGSPADAACAAVALARFPVDAHATVRMPSSMAFEIATDTTRSLNDSVGWLTASFFTHSSRTPRRLARRSARTIGVMPVCSPTVGAPSSGRSSAYRHMVGARDSITARVSALPMAG